MKRARRLTRREQRQLEAKSLPNDVAHCSVEDRADGTYIILNKHGEPEQAFGPFLSKEDAKQALREVSLNTGVGLIGPGADN
jgi:hypothetical protein